MLFRINFSNISLIKFNIIKLFLEIDISNVYTFSSFSDVSRFSNVPKYFEFSINLSLSEISLHNLKVDVEYIGLLQKSFIIEIQISAYATN